MITDQNNATSQESDLGKQAKDTAASAVDAAKEGARQAADTATAEATRYANQTKESVADEVRSVSSALRSAASDMRSGSPQERTFSQIAEGLADASDAVRDKDLGEIVGDLNRFAKNNPLVFLGSAALIGFAATRFVKASAVPVSRTEPTTASDYTARPVAQPRSPASMTQPYNQTSGRRMTGETS